MASLRPAQKALVVWWTAYLLSLPFTNVWVLPLVGQKLQLPELVFLLGMPVWLWLPPRLLSHSLDKVLLLFPGAMVVSAIISPGVSAFLEVLGLVYLYGVYVLSRQAVCFVDSNLMKGILRLGLTLVIVISLVSIVAGVMQWEGSGYFAERKWLPFVGEVFRINGTSVSPNLWFSILAFYSILNWKLNKGEQGFWLMTLFAVFSMLATFSKSILGFTGVLLMSFTQKCGWLRYLSLVTFAVYLFSVHFLITPPKAQRASVSYLPEQACTAVYGGELCYTTYWLLKEKAVEAFVESKGLGVGGGQFTVYLNRQQALGEYPVELTAKEPHSSYFGLLAETGILGVIASGAVILSIVRFRRRQLLEGIQQAALLYCFLLAVDAFVMDVLNFRMLWVAFGHLIGHNNRELG